MGRAEDGVSDWRAAGERIEALLDASAAGGTMARARAEQLVREVVGLYGAGLGRILELLEGYPDAVTALAGDDLVASLLLVHGLHPHDVETRVRTALDGVRPYLGSHGGDVALLGVRDGVVRLRLLGSCRSCPSSAVTLELAVQDAVRAAAPETVAIEVETAEPASATGRGVIPAESLLSHLHGASSNSGASSNGGVPSTGGASSTAGGSWLPVPELAELTSGEIGGFAVAGLPILVCRLGDEFYAYRDRCPVCTNTLAGAALQRRAANEAVLRCPSCRAHYDVRRAGARVGAGDEHLDPLPVLVRDGVLSVAVPSSVPG